MANSIKFMNEGFEAKYGDIKPDLCEQIYTVLKSLTEAKMSPEDEEDTKLLYSIYDKKLQRSNAKLTPEEQEVLKKYNLGDVYSYKNNWGAKRATTGYTQGSDVYEPIKRGQHIRGTETNRKVNLADRARKMGMRAYNKGAVGEYDRELKNNYNTMKNDIWSREYHQKELDSLDKSYDEKEAKLLKQLDSLKKSRESSRRYHQQSLDTSKSHINKLLKRESLLSEDKLTGFNDGERLKHEINEFLENLVIRWNHEYDIQLTRADIDNAYEFVLLHFLWDDILDESGNNLDEPLDEETANIGSPVCTLDSLKRDAYSSEPVPYGDIELMRFYDYDGDSFIVNPDGFGLNSYYAFYQQGDSSWAIYLNNDSEDPYEPVQDDLSFEEICEYLANK